MDLRQLSRELWRRWKLAGARLRLGFLGSLSLTPTYQSQSSRVYLTAAASGTSTDAYQLGLYSPQRIATHVDLAQDPDLVLTVMNRAGVSMSPAEFAPNVSAVPVPDIVVSE